MFLLKKRSRRIIEADVIAFVKQLLLLHSSRAECDSINCSLRLTLEPVLPLYSPPSIVVVTIRHRSNELELRSPPSRHLVNIAGACMEGQSCNKTQDSRENELLALNKYPLPSGRNQPLLKESAPSLLLSQSSSKAQI